MHTRLPRKYLSFTNVVFIPKILLKGTLPNFARHTSLEQISRLQNKIYCYNDDVVLGNYFNIFELINCLQTFR